VVVPPTPPDAAPRATAPVVTPLPPATPKPAATPVKKPRHRQHEQEDQGDDKDQDLPAEGGPTLTLPEKTVPAPASGGGDDDKTQ
jgi:hypothetical protein